MAVSTDAKKTGVLVERSEAPVVALLGDSISDYNTINSSAIKAFYVRGHMGWANVFGGKRLTFPLAYNFGVPGDRLSQMLARVPSVVASGASCVVVHGGTNDLSNGGTFSQMQADMLALLVPLLSCSAIRHVVVIPILPRTGITATQQAVRARFNNWLCEIGMGRSDLASALPFGRFPVVVNANAQLEDMTNGTPIGGAGGAASAVTVDGLHPSSNGAFWVGYQLAQVLATLYPARRTDVLGYLDTYDATNNPAGNLLITGGVNAGIMAGTGGSLVVNTGLTPTGSVANGWRLLRIGAGSTSTATLVGAKQSPRNDLTNPSATGERQRVTATVTGAGGTSEGYSLSTLPATISSANFAVGDTVFAECKVEVLAGASNLQTIALQLQETGPATPQNAWDLLLDSTNLQTLPGIAWSGVLRSPPITLQSGITALTMSVNAYLGAATGSAGVDFYVSDCVLRKHGP